MKLFGFRGTMKRFGPAVTTSIVIHTTLLIALGFYLAYTKIEVVHQVVTSFIIGSFEPLKQEVTKPREVAIKPEVFPQIPQAPVFAPSPILVDLTNSTSSGDKGNGGGGVGGAPRTLGTGKGIGGAVGIGKFAVDSSIEIGYSGRYRSGVSTQTVNVPGKILGTDKVSPGIVTDPTVTTPGDLTYTGPAGSGTGIGGGKGFGEGSGSGIGIRRGLVGVQAKVPRGIETKLQGIGISMAARVSAAEASAVLNTASQAITIGYEEVPPLSKGEPGGIIIGRGKDIKGRIHFVKLDDPLDPGADI